MTESERIEEPRADSASASGLWSEEALGLSPEQSALVPHVQAWLQRTYPSLVEALEGQPLSGPVPERTAEMVQAVLREKEWGGASQAADVLRILSKVLERARESGHVAFPPSFLVQVERSPVNPFAGANLRDGLETVEAWQQLLERWIECVSSTACVSQPVAPDDVWLPCVLLSAILYGGLLHGSSLVALLRTLAGEERAGETTCASSLQPAVDRLQLPLALPWRGQAGAEYRVWYPDPLTATLLLRLPRHQVRSFWERKPGENATADLSDAATQRRLWKLLRTAFRRASRRKLMNSLPHPSSLTNLLSTVALTARLDLPIVLVEYATRRVRSHSWKPKAWARIFGQAPAPRPIDIVEQETPLSVASDWHFEPQLEDRSQLEPDWLLALRRALRGDEPKQIRQQVYQLEQAEIEPRSGRRITEFAGLLLKNGSSAGRSLALSTIRNCVSTVSRRFGCLLGGADPTEFSRDTLESLYRQVLAEADPDNEHGGLRRNVARSLHEFHEFLVCHYASPPIPREVFGLGQGLLAVDANGITVEEYGQTLTYLGEQSQVLPLARRVERLLTTLGFRAGLRRMEAFGLQAHDLCEQDPAELLIRPWKARRLKTHSATRKLPLSALLTEQELEQLRAWKHDRAGWAAPDNPFLWTLPGSLEASVSPDMLVEDIHRALREVTGDPDLHYHHLRHSCATWSSLRLLRAELPLPTPALFPHLPQTSEWLQQGPRFATQLYGHASPTRKHLWAVASLLGHSSPATTTEHYIHCLDLALADALSVSDLLRPASSLVQLASGLPATTFHRWLREASHLAVIPLRLYGQDRPAEPERPARHSVSPALQLAGSDEPSWTELLWHFLYQSEVTPAFRERKEDVSWHEFAEQHGMNSSAAQEVLQRADQIFTLRTPQGKERHHRVTAKNFSQADLRRIPLRCPVYPHARADQAVDRRLAPHLARCFQQNPAGTQEVLTYYVQHVVESHNRVSFREPDQARRYLDFLQHIGIRQHEIRMSSGQPARWRKALGLTQRLKIQSSSSLRASELAIEPAFDKLKGRGGAGFRFVMVMAALAGDQLRRYGSAAEPAPETTLA